MKAIIVCSLLTMAIFNLIAFLTIDPGHEFENHVRTTLGGLILGGIIGYFVDRKLKRDAGF